jgi:hypothetical protein
VRRIAAQPVSVRCWRDHEVTDQDRKIRVGVWQLVCVPSRAYRDPTGREYLGNGVHEWAEADHRNVSGWRWRRHCDEYSGHSIEEVIAFVGVRPREHLDTAAADASNKGGENSLLDFGDIVQYDLGWVDANLDARGGPPHHGQSRVYVQNHLPILHIAPQVNAEIPQRS